MNSKRVVRKTEGRGKKRKKKGAFCDFCLLRHIISQDPADSSKGKERSVSYRTSCRLIGWLCIKATYVSRRRVCHGKQKTRGDCGRQRTRDGSGKSHQRRDLEWFPWTWTGLRIRVGTRSVPSVRQRRRGKQQGKDAQEPERQFFCWGQKQASSPSSQQAGLLSETVRRMVSWVWVFLKVSCESSRWELLQFPRMKVCPYQEQLPIGGDNLFQGRVVCAKTLRCTQQPRYQLRTSIHYSRAVLESDTNGLRHIGSFREDPSQRHEPVQSRKPYRSFHRGCCWVGLCEHQRSAGTEREESGISTGRGHRVVGRSEFGTCRCPARRQYKFPQNRASWVGCLESYFRGSSASKDAAREVFAWRRSNPQIHCSFPLSRLFPSSWQRRQYRTHRGPVVFGTSRSPQSLCHLGKIC
eukprot:06866_4